MSQVTLYRRSLYSYEREYHTIARPRNSIGYDQALRSWGWSSYVVFCL